MSASSVAPIAPILYHPVSPHDHQVCFCGRPARHARYTDGLIWTYCVRHWNLWYTRHMQQPHHPSVNTVKRFPNEPEAGDLPTDSASNASPH
jgi:hypothetical protein